MCILVALLVGLTACTPETTTPINVSCDDFAEQPHIVKVVQLYAKSSVVVTLCSNQTTGFAWPESAQISDPAVVEQIDHRYEPPQGDIVGAAGQEVWTFKALEQGQSNILLEYSRPWEGGEKGAWSLTLVVVVQ